ncbi:di-trans,poly-cis-decaprenylcistransferase [Anaplasmataceae bacterium AB001_6]|nr:di-trans,poly-cis-decaprenylcistransferase [Anaplasmataceae bacterium AB001_6]
MVNLNHVAFIMDGNFRWSGINKVPLLESYHRGFLVAKSMLEHLLFNYDLTDITFYVLSRDNFMKRSEENLKAILDVIENIKYTDDMYYNDRVSYSLLGDKDIIDSLKFRMNFVEKNKTDLSVNLAIGYSSRFELVEAFRKFYDDYKKTSLEDDFFSYDNVKKYFYSDFSDPDLIIRTGGMKRLSDFLLMQSAYSELYFTDILWPDFTIRDLDIAIDVFNRTKRNYGR